MKINFVTQAPNIPKTGIDYFICSSGFESRGPYFYLLNESKLVGSRKICFRFPDRKELSRPANDKTFEEHKFEFIDITSQSIEDYLILYHSLFISTTSKVINVVVDFSCMTTTIYASLLKYFFSLTDTFIEASIYFSYTTALFAEPSTTEPLVYNHPISIFDTLQTTDKKIALIIGLGFEKDRALGLCQYFDNDKDDIYLFATIKTPTNKYFDSVIMSNQELFKSVSPENIIYYDLDNVTHLISTFDSLVNYLINSNTRVVIAPIGPKQFTLVSLLINLFHNEVTTYRFSHGDKGKPIDRKADESKNSIITHLNFRIDQLNKE